MIEGMFEHLQIDETDLTDAPDVLPEPGEKPAAVRPERDLRLNPRKERSKDFSEIENGEVIGIVKKLTPKRGDSI